MRWFITLLSLTAFATAQETPSLDEARVQLTYKELRSLIDAAKAHPPAESPVESAILSAHYDVQFREGTAGALVAYEVQTFRDGPHVVPLAGGGLIIESIEPKDAVVVVRDGLYALAVEGKQRVKATLRFTMPVRQAEDGLVIECAICPAVSASVQVRDIPHGRHATVENGLLMESAGNAAKWQLGRSPLLLISLRDEPKPAPPPITMPAVIGEAQSEMRVVSDGAFSNKMKWRIRHHAPLVWRLELPENLQIVSAHAGGKPASPSRVDAKTLEFRLPEPGAGEETLVELSYTGKGPAFDPASGALALTLPATSLLLEKLQWRVSVPAAYETAVAGGNMDLQPGKSAGEIILSKEFCQSEPPAVRLTYQIPPSITMAAVIHDAQSDMRVVSDGAFSNKMTWRIRHQAPLVWNLNLPENFQIVSAHIGGKPASPSRADAKTLKFRLPEPARGEETLVELNYTGKGQAFNPVRGELALALPSTPLLIENLQWRVAIPAAFETVAAQGNVDFLPSKTAGEILLGKELCQGEAPAVQLFYKKPETNRNHDR